MSIPNKQLAEKLDAPQRMLHPKFIAGGLHSGNECARCFVKIEVGDFIRYDSDSNLVHALHRHPTHVYSICNSCYLTKPCECED